MTPQILSPNHERGYYIVWDTVTWRKDRVSGQVVFRIPLHQRPWKTDPLHSESSLCITGIWIRL